MIFPLEHLNISFWEISQAAMFVNFGTSSYKAWGPAHVCNRWHRTNWSRAAEISRRSASPGIDQLEIKDVIENHHLVGGWATPKNMSSSVGIIIPNIY
jgi:hypothetical protein